MDNNNQQQRDLLLRQGATLAFFGLIVSAVAGWGFTGAAYVIQVDDKNCFDDQVQARSFASLANIVSLVCFMAFAKKMRQLGNFNYLCLYIVGCVFCLLNVGVVGFSVDIFRACADLRNSTQLQQVYYRETVQTVSTYALNDLILIVSLWEHDIHLDIFFWMAALVAAEIAQSWANNEHVHHSFVFNYFNIKLSILIFEAGVNCKYTDLFSFDQGRYGAEHPWVRLLNFGIFLFYMGFNFAKQLYYNQPGLDRWNPYPVGHDEQWEIVFWVAAGGEIACCLYLLCQAIYWRVTYRHDRYAPIE